MHCTIIILLDRVYHICGQMSKIHIYCTIIYYLARFQTLKINYAVNGHDMYCTCVFFHLYVSHIWTRTPTELPSVRGVMGFTKLIYCTVFNTHDIFYYLTMTTNHLNMP